MSSTALPSGFSEPFAEFPGASCLGRSCALPGRARRRRFSSLGHLDVQWIVGVKLWDGQLPQVLLQVSCAKLALRHKRRHEIIQSVAVNDCQ